MKCNFNCLDSCVITSTKEHKSYCVELSYLKIKSYIFHLSDFPEKNNMPYSKSWYEEKGYDRFINEYEFLKTCRVII